MLIQALSFGLLRTVVGRQDSNNQEILIRNRAISESRVSSARKVSQSFFWLASSSFETSLVVWSGVARSLRTNCELELLGELTVLIPNPDVHVDSWALSSVLATTGLGVVAMPHLLPQELVDHTIDYLWDDKKSLKSCSLVCKRWTASSSSHLFNRFLWPPCNTARKTCDTTFCEEGYFVHLLEAVSSTVRLSNAIRTLLLSIHASPCPRIYETVALPLPIVFEIFDLIPSLHAVKLHFWRLAHPPFTEHLAIAKLNARVIEELEIDGRMDALPHLLSAFRRITKLTIDGRFTAGPKKPWSPVSNGTLEVRSITILRGGDDAIPRALQGLMDFQAVRSLTLPHAPTRIQPTLAPIIRSMSSLESLGYYLVDNSSAPAELEGCVRLRSVMVGGRFTALAVGRPDGDDDEVGHADEIDHEDVGVNSNEAAEQNIDDRQASAIEDDGSDHDAAWVNSINVTDIQGGGIGYSEWEPMLRDLRILVTEVTEDVAVYLHVDETYTTDDISQPDDPEDIMKALRKAFSLLDWAGLSAVVEKCSFLRSLRFEILYMGFIDPKDCAEILRAVACEKLSSDMVGKLHLVICREYFKHTTRARALRATSQRTRNCFPCCLHWRNIAFCSYILQCSFV